VYGALLPRHVVAVTAFVRDERARVLLVRSGARGWEMPGGCVEPGEDLDEALRREVAEETGCEVEVRSLIGVHCRLSEPELVLFHFACRHVAGEPRPSDETPAVGWFSPGRARALVRREPAAGRLRDALLDGGRGGVVHRVYRARPFELLHETTLAVAGDAAAHARRPRFAARPRRTV
jgi:8-oxo-dGTP diphosphatase